MNELVRISDLDLGHGLVKTVDGRDLHEKLGVQKDFSDWTKNQIRRCKFIEGRDYAVFPFQGENSGRPSKEYAFTLYAAKHIAMMSGTDKGSEIRDYFIEVEEKWRSNLLNEQIAGAIAVQVGTAVAAAMVTVVNEIRQSLLPMANALGEKPGYRTIERQLELLGPAALGIDDLDQVARGERSSLGRAMVKRTKTHKVKVLYTTNALSQRVAMFKAWILDRYFLEDFKRIHGAPRRQLTLFPVPGEGR